MRAAAVACVVLVSFTWAQHSSSQRSSSDSSSNSNSRSAAGILSILLVPGQDIAAVIASGRLHYLDDFPELLQLQLSASEIYV